MVLSLLIIVILLSGFLRGYRRGLVRQGLMTLGYLVVWLLARLWASPLGQWLQAHLGTPSLTNHQSQVAAAQTPGFFYTGVAGLLVILIGSVIVARLVRLTDHITRFPVIHQVNALAGGLLNGVIRYVVVFLCLNLLILWPNQTLQNSYEQSPVAQWIVTQTPGLSSAIYNWWVTSPAVHLERGPI